MRLALTSRDVVAVSPAAQRTVAGRSTTFATELGVAGTAVWRWQHDGQEVLGANRPNLVLHPTTASHAGRYRASATIAGRTLVSDEVALVVDPSNARLANLSC